LKLLHLGTHLVRVDSELKYLNESENILKAFIMTAGLLFLSLSQAKAEQITCNTKIMITQDFKIVVDQRGRQLSYQLTHHDNRTEPVKKGLGVRTMTRSEITSDVMKSLKEAKINLRFVESLKIYDLQDILDSSSGRRWVVNLISVTMTDGSNINIANDAGYVGVCQ